MSGQQAVTGISLTAVGPNTDPAHMDAMMQANSLGVVKNNEGNVARDQGQLDRALALHQEALELKIRGFGEESVQAAISFNALGVTYLKMGGDKLDAAEKAFSKALNVRDDTAFGGLGIGSRIDAAASRDDMARVLEAKGKMDEAKAMRLRGAAKGEVICGSNRCVTPGGALLSESQCKACGACKSVFYCGAACQKQDWKARHKPLCKAYNAAKITEAV